MPKFTRGGVFRVLSFAYLAALTILASYSLYQANYFSLPMAKTLPVLFVALPLLAGILYETIVTFKRRSGARGALEASTIFQMATAVLLVLEAVLATLAGVHIAPVTGLECPLLEQWLSMYSNHEGNEILRIQNALQCCGLRTLKHMDWPLVDEHHPGVNCSVRYERDKACLGPWMAVERKVAIMMLVVPIGVFFWKVTVILAPNLNATWLPSAIQLPHDEPHDRDIRHHRAIEYPEAEEQTDGNSARDEVARLNQDADRATHASSGRMRHNTLIREQDIDAWRRA